MYHVFQLFSIQLLVIKTRFSLSRLMINLHKSSSVFHSNNNKNVIFIFYNIVFKFNSFLIFF